MSSRSSFLVLGALVAGLLPAGCGESERGSTRAAQPSDVRESSEPTEPVCDYPSARPSYLPWLDRGQKVPAPERDPSDGYAQFFWAPDDDKEEWAGAYVSFSTYSAYEIRGEPTELEYEGMDGQLDVGPTGMGIVWQTSSKDYECNTTTLSFKPPQSMSRSDVRSELERVAESLRPE